MIHLVGNVMIDSLVQFRDRAAELNLVDEWGLDSDEFLLITMHRPSNVDSESGVRELHQLIERLAQLKPLVFPMHPRTRNRFEEFGLLEAVQAVPDVLLKKPLGYLSFLHLMDHAGVVITDSGGGSGGDYVPAGTLSHTPREYRAASYRRARHQRADVS
jgi:UDP-N-acetylglucosamine 2-epimerase (non-hydrolysing)